MGFSGSGHRAVARQHGRRGPMKRSAGRPVTCIGQLINAGARICRGVLRLILVRDRYFA